MILFLLIFFIVMIPTSDALESPATSPLEQKGIILKEGGGFTIEVAFPSDPQVETTIAKVREFLLLTGLKDSAADSLRILVRQDRSLADGGYRIEGNSIGITVEASDAEGVRIGLIALLHRLGIRWYDPSDKPLVPVLPATVANFKEEGQPSFPYRGLHICAGTDHYDERLAEWMSFQGMNRKLTSVGELERIGDKLNSHGILPDTTVHSYRRWIPDDKYFSSNPDFFALIGGRRVRQKDGGQLCLSNQAMREVFIGELEQFLKQHPETAVVGIPPNDGYGWCECDECRALDTTEDRENGGVNGRVANFVEAVCGAIQQSYPKVLVGHYSYSNFSDFHKELRDVPSNLMVSCTTFRCYRHAIDDPDCPTNRNHFIRMQELRSKVKHVYVYDYLYFRWPGLPQPQWRVAAQDIAAYARLGLDGYMTETPGALSSSMESGHLTLYVIARLLYDRNQSLDALLDDYCKMRFESGARTMRSYLTLWESAVQGMEGCMRHHSGDLERLVSPETVAEAHCLLAKAAKETSGKAYEAVQRETGLLEGWVRILEERRAIGKDAEVRVGTMEEFAAELEETAYRDDGILLLDSSLKIRPTDHETRARFYLDRETLGIVIDCKEDDMAKVVDKAGNSLSSVYHSECVEIFLSDGADKSICYHILASISGGHVASECVGTRWNWSWKGDYQLETKRFDRHWKVFFRIPLRKTNSSDHVGLTIIRNRQVDQRKISGAPDGGAFFDTQKYLKIPLLQ